MVQTYQRITTNAKLGKGEWRTFQEKKYYVVNAVMMVHGVHEGSKGKLYYPDEELAKTPEVWNMKPAVADHPTINGQGVSACQPDIIETQSVGLVMNNSYKDEKWQPEVYLDPVPTEKFFPNMIADLEAGKNRDIEVSTGLFTDDDPTPGVFNTSPYDAVARNYRPDHLAILVNKKGACSCKDGCGLARNESLTDNAKARSFHGIHQDVAKHVRSTHGSDAYVRDVYNDFLVFSRSGYNDAGDYSPKYYSQKYNRDEKSGEVSLKGTPEEIQNVTEYRTKGGSFVGNSSFVINSEEIQAMQKKDIVDSLIKNHGYAEGERTQLMTLDDPILSRMVPKTIPAPAPAPAANASLTNNNAPAPGQPTTPQQYIDQSPAAFRPILQNALNSHNAEVNRLVEICMNNGKNRFTKEALVLMGTNDFGSLQAIAALAESQMINPLVGNVGVGGSPAIQPYGPFAGAGGGVLPVLNAGGGYAPTHTEPLVMPTINDVETK